MSDHVATVAGIYQAFGEGNIQKIVDALADDVQWEDFDSNFGHRSGTPWLQRGAGKDHVARFFGIIGTWQVTAFSVKSLLAGEHKVAAEIEISATLPSGASFSEQEIHLWTFNGEGKVSNFRHYCDTAKHLATAGKAIPAAVRA